MLTSMHVAVDVKLCDSARMRIICKVKKPRINSV